MAEIPWFAWIAIVGIVVWGLVAAVGSTTGRPHKSGDDAAHREEIEHLKRRIEDLEARLNRGA